MTKADRVGAFINKHAVACGGNWGAMVMSAIKNGLPDVYAKLEDGREYEFVELCEIIANNLPEEETE